MSEQSAAQAQENELALPPPQWVPDAIVGPLQIEGNGLLNPSKTCFTRDPAGDGSEAFEAWQLGRIIMELPSKAIAALASPPSNDITSLMMPLYKRGLNWPALAAFTVGFKQEHWKMLRNWVTDALRIKALTDLRTTARVQRMEQWRLKPSTSQLALCAGSRWPNLRADQAVKDRLSLAEEVRNNVQALIHALEVSMGDAQDNLPVHAQEHANTQEDISALSAPSEPEEKKEEAHIERAPEQQSQALPGSDEHEARKQALLIALEEKKKEAAAKAAERKQAKKQAERTKELEMLNRRLAEFTEEDKESAPNASDEEDEEKYGASNEMVRQAWERHLADMASKASNASSAFQPPRYASARPLADAEAKAFGEEQMKFAASWTALNHPGLVVMGSQVWAASERQLAKYPTACIRALCKVLGFETQEGASKKMLCESVLSDWQKSFNAAQAADYRCAIPRCLVKQQRARRVTQAPDSDEDPLAANEGKETTARKRTRSEARATDDPHAEAKVCLMHARV